MEKYCALIEFLKSEYLEHVCVTLGKEVSQTIKDIQNFFDIKVSMYDNRRFMHIKVYEIKSKTDEKSWNIIIGPASFLYAANMEKYRADLLDKKIVNGIFTLKNAFFKLSSIPTAVIVLGDSSEGVWLTSAITTEDVLSLMKDIGGYGRKVYYTDKLNPKNFMPEFYNGGLNEVNSELDKFETKELQEIADIINGKNAKPSQLVEKGIPYLRGRNLQGGKITDIDTFVAEEAVGEFSKQLLEEGDILLQKQFGYHKIARVTEDALPAIASSGLYIIRAFDVPEDYLYSYLTSETGKAIFEKQLKSIERGATIVSIGLGDLKKLRVPMFDKQTMSNFANIETIKIKDIMPTIKSVVSCTTPQTDRLSGLESIALVQKVFNDLLLAEWQEDELKCNSGSIKLIDSMLWKPDIAITNNGDLLAVVEVRQDFSMFREEWLKKMNAIIESRQAPFLIISNGTYYEIHSTKDGAVKKMLTAPTKGVLLSLLNGKGAN